MPLADQPVPVPILRMPDPLVTVVVPSFNQGLFLEEALASIFVQDVPVEVYVLDGGSTDNSPAIIERYAPRLAGWRSQADDGQAAAINEGVSRGTAPYVCWLNSDDWFLPGGLSTLVAHLEKRPDAPAVYGRVWNFLQDSGSRKPVWIQKFSERNMSIRCVVSQPGTLIRRSAWEEVGGVDTGLHMAMDYDLWWRLFKKFGPLALVDDFVAVNREHSETKTRRLRRRHYQEAMAIVQKYHGRIPAKWWLIYPYAVWWKASQ